MVRRSSVRTRRPLRYLKELEARRQAAAEARELQIQKSKQPVKKQEEINSLSSGGRLAAKFKAKEEKAEKRRRGEEEEEETQEKQKPLTLPPPSAICHDAALCDFSRCRPRDVDKDPLFPEEDAARRAQAAAALAADDDDYNPGDGGGDDDDDDDDYTRADTLATGADATTVSAESEPRYRELERRPRPDWCPPGYVNGLT